MAIDPELVLRRKRHNLLATSLRDAEKALEMLQRSIKFTTDVRDSLAPEADAALAEMEKKTETEPDETPIVAGLRAEMRDYLGSELRRFADDPTTDPYVQAYRDGIKAASANALGFIDKVMEKKPEKQNDGNPPE